MFNVCLSLHVLIFLVNFNEINFYKYSIIDAIKYAMFIWLSPARQQQKINACFPFSRILRFTQERKMNQITN